MISLTQIALDGAVIAVDIQLPVSDVDVISKEGSCGLNCGFRGLQVVHLKLLFFAENLS